MKLYVLKCGNYEEGFDVMGIYSTKERAETEKSFCENDRTLLEWYIDEFELDKNEY